VALTQKAAKWMTKQLKSAKGKPEEKGVKGDITAMKMQDKTEAELNKIRKSGGERGKAANFELDRREANRRSKAIGGTMEPDYAAMTGPKLREMKKAYSGKKKFEELDPKVLGFDPSDYAKGGVVKKKPAAKKPAVKKPTKKGK
jgi:hypothetical protein